MTSHESNAVIARALLAEFDAGKDMAAVTTSLAAYLVLEHRQSDTQAIVRELERLLLTEKSKLYVHATVAFVLTAERLAEITTIFAQESGAKEVIIQQTIDKDVIGGVRLQTADQQLDLTVRRQLQLLKNTAPAVRL